MHKITYHELSEVWKIGKKKKNGFYAYLRRVAEIYFRQSINSCAAELSYYFLLSFFPTLISVYASFKLAGVDHDEFSSFFRGMLPKDLTILFQNYIMYIDRITDLDFLLIGVFLTLISASRYINVMKKKIRAIYGMRDDAKVIREWLISVIFAIFTILGFYILLAVIVFGENLALRLFDAFSIPDSFSRVILDLRFLVTAVYLFFLLSLMYFAMLGGKRRISGCFPGALFSMVASTLISYGFSYYVDNIARYAFLYGSFGGFIVLLLWIYLINNVFLIGASVNRALDGTEK